MVDRLVAEPRNDTAANRIQAHGGSMLFHDGTYYWYGENKGGPTLPSSGCEYRTDVIGISCYSSTDLHLWRNEGLVLEASPDTSSDLHPSRVVERPRVLWNQRDHRFVMWLHIDVENYSLARVGVAVSDQPTGPFRYVGSFWPNGVDSRDLTVFVTPHGDAYLMHASDWNRTLRVARLSADYLGVREPSVPLLIDQEREAPAVWFHDGRYFLLTSGCTGWDPNPPLVAVAESMLGPWRITDNPLRWPDGFDAQGSYVLPLPGEPDRFLLMADRWLPTDLGASEYRWFEIDMSSGEPRIDPRPHGPGSLAPTMEGMS